MWKERPGGLQAAARAEVFIVGYQIRRILARVHRAVLYKVGAMETFPQPDGHALSIQSVSVPDRATATPVCVCDRMRHGQWAKAGAQHLTWPSFETLSSGVCCTSAHTTLQTWAQVHTLRSFLMTKRGSGVMPPRLLALMRYGEKPTG